MHDRLKDFTGKRKRRAMPVRAYIKSQEGMLLMAGERCVKCGKSISGVARVSRRGYDFHGKF